MAISSLLRRLGFVKLDSFGLVLTPDGRIMSVRPTVLDDGLGGKIVGWQEGDLAAMELHPWQPTAPAKQPQPTLRAKLPTAPPPIPQRPVSPTAPTELAQPARPALPGMSPPPMMQSIAVAQPIGAAPPKQPRPLTPIPLETHPIARVDDPAEEIGEDEWEWEIAVARARAQAEWAAEAAKKKRATSPIAIVAEPKPHPMEAWPQTEPLMETWEPTSNSNAPVRVLPRQKSPTPPKPIVIADHAAVLAARQATRAAAARTPPAVRVAREVIANESSTARSTLKQREPLQRVEPKRPVTTTSTVVTSAPRRYPRATPETKPYANLGEDTQVTHTPAPANLDQTRPGLLLPSASTTRRVAAKQR